MIKMFISPLSQDSGFFLVLTQLRVCYILGIVLMKTLLVMFFLAQPSARNCSCEVLIIQNPEPSIFILFALSLGIIEEYDYLNHYPSGFFFALHAF